MKCYNCNGTGLTPFKHIANGICFVCQGTGEIKYDDHKDEISLMHFHKNFKPNIDSGHYYKQIKNIFLGDSGVDRGGIYLVKKINDSIILWRNDVNANWHFNVSSDCRLLLKEYFKKN